MKVFITGGTGFIGENLINKLVAKNYEVYALCRNVTDRKINLPKEVNIVWGDLIDPHHLKKSIRDINPDYVLHLAAQSSVAYSHQHAMENASTTYLGTINLQKACKDLPNLEKFVFAGTSEEYGNQTIYPIKENQSLIPNQPYAIAKVAADSYLQYCKESTGFPSITLRPFNSYGRTRNYTFVTESIIYQMLTQKDVVLGNPNPTRDLVYVDDHVNGYLKAIETPYEKLEHVFAINICTGEETSIKTLAEKIAKYTGFKGEIKWNVKNRPTEIHRLVGDWSLAFNYLGWRPSVTLDEGLTLTINRMREILKK